MTTMILSAIFKVDWLSYRSELLAAALRTLEFTAASFAGAALLGMVVALARLGQIKALRLVAACYTELFKNVPLLVVIFFAYFGLPGAGIVFSVFEAGVVSLIVFYAAYLSEIFRAAIEAVDCGQREAAEALGFGRLTTFTHVILPQAARVAMPGTNTMLVDLLKSTSLLVTISGAELMTQAQLIASQTFQPSEVYAVIGLIYFLLCYPLSQLLLWFERKIRDGVPLYPVRRRRVKLIVATIKSQARA